MPLTSTELVDHALARIAEVNDVIAAVCTINDGAVAQARERDRETSAGHTRGPLHGIPVLVKDNVDTADLPTTAGSLSLAALPNPSRDAELVRRLRDAGMVVVGKANLSEWANIRDANSVSGWSAYGGLTRNPYALNRSAGGSSSGSGAAIAAGIVDFAVGTETDGSITCPAAFNGCVGLKPTVGLVPRGGVVPISSTQDSPGPMTRTVRGAAAMLSAMSSHDYLVSVAPDRLRGIRIGVPRRDYWGYTEHADRHAERALDLLSAAGAQIVDNTDLPRLPEEVNDGELTVMLAELRTGLAEYLSTRPGDGPRSLEDVVAFNREHADEEMPHFGQDLFEKALAGSTTDDPEYLAAQRRCVQWARDEAIDAVLAKHRLDALISPSYAPAFLTDLVNPESVTGSCTQPAAMAGYPLLTVPSGMARGLPVAISLWGSANSEANLLDIGATYEAARDNDTGPLPLPTYLPYV